MPRTPEQEARYQQLGHELGFFGNVPTAAPERPGLGERALRSLGNAPSMALEGMMGIGTGLANLARTEENQLTPFNVPRTFDLPQAETGMEMLADLPGQFAGIAPQFALPGAGIFKGAQALGAGARLASVLGQTGGGLLGGLSVSPEMGAYEGGIGAAQGFAQNLPRAARIPLALAAGVIGAAEAYDQEQSTTGSKMGDALAFGALNFGTTFIGSRVPGTPGASPHAPQGGRVGSVEEEAFKQMNPAQRAAHIDAIMGRSGPAYTEPPDIQRLPSRGLFANPTQPGIGGGQPIIGQPTAPAGLFGGGRGVMTSPTRMRRSDDFAGLQELPSGAYIPDEQDMMQAGLFGEGGLTANFTPPGEGGLMLRSTEPRTNLITDIGSAPQVRRPLFGPASDLDTGGYGRGEDPFNIFGERGVNHPFLSETPPPAAAANIADLQNIRPAIMAGERRILGQPHETHQDILDRLKVEDEAAWVDAMDTFGGSKDTNHFVDAAGNPISRDELSAAHGVRDSQGLREKQGWKSPTRGPVAFRLEDGRIISGKGNDPHFSLLDQMTEAESNTAERGWIDSNGKFLTPGQAQKLSSGVKLKKGQMFTAENIEAAQKKSSKAVANVAPKAADVEPTPAPVQPQTPPPDARPRVRVAGSRPGEWHEAVVIGKEGKALHLEIDDPIFGPRTATVLESETLQIAALQKPIEGGGRPFQDVESVALTGKEGARGTLRGGGEGDMLGSMLDPTPGSSKNPNDSAAIIEAVLDGRKNYGEITGAKARKMAANTGLAVDPRGGIARTSEELRVGMAQLQKNVRDKEAGLITKAEFWQRQGELFGYRQEEIDNWIASMQAKGVNLGSMIEGSGPAHTPHTLQGYKKTILTIQEGLDLLPAEPRALLGEILHQVNVAVGRNLDVHFARDMHGAKGAAYTDSGRIGVNLNWLNGIVQNWDTMTPATQNKALMRATALFGHEVSHVVHRFAEKSGMTIGGVPVTDAIVAAVGSMSQSSKKYVAEQILKGKGEGNVSQRVLNYLSGDIDQVHKWYSARRPGLTRDESVRLAAGEVMAEIGSIELVNRMNVQGLPQGFREIIDRFKQVLINVVKWFTDNGKQSEFAALQNLQKMSAKMYDHFGAADNARLASAFPTSGAWKPAPVVNPFSSVAPAPGTPGSSVAVAPAVQVLDGPLLKQEMLRLGVRGLVGATLGGFAGPELAPNQVSTAEGILLGGIAGIFGPAVAKKLLSADFPTEAKAALKAYPRNPLKALGHIMGGGKSLNQLGIEGRFGWTGVGNSMAKWVRWTEQNFDLNLDPAQKALSEQARGMGAEQLAIINDALDKVRWYKPSPSMVSAVGAYFEGKISKADFEALLTSPELKNYGNFIVAAREGMTTLSRMFGEGLPKGAFKEHVMKTSEQYLGKFYSAYTEGKFKVEHFDKAKNDLATKFGYSDKTADDLMHEYMREVQANRKMFSTGRRGESGEKLDSSTLKRRMATEEEIEGQMVVVGGLEHDTHGADYKREKAKLDWMLEHKITDNWRLWLGEFTDPIERMIYTIQKIHPSAISGKTFDLLDSSVHTNGNKFSYTPKELGHTRELLESALNTETDPKEIAALQNRLRELNGYGPVPEGAAYGKVSGKWVDRFTRDSLSTYDSPYKWMEQPIIRSLAEFNNLIKVGHTAYNPVTILRNYIQMSVMALIARTNAGDVSAAFKEIHYTRGDNYRLMLRRHIIGGDFVSSELSKGPGTIFSGYLDADIATKASKAAHRAVLKNYQQPDMLVRAGAFISARKRFAQEAWEKGIEETDVLGVKTTTRFADLQEAMAHPNTIDRAVEFTNRYTMNYATVPAIIKAGRQLPFVNLYISYTAEITRILKNLTEDMIAPGPNSAGRMHAITTLGAMVAIPTVMTMMGRGSLSDRDRADWDKIEKLSPHYNRSRFRVPYKREVDGRFRFFDITNLLPADNYSQMVKAFVSGDAEAFWKANPLVSLQNTPLLNMATEQITGEDIHTGQVIQGYGRVREILKEVLPPILPPGYEGQRLIRAFSTNVEGEAGLTNMRTGVQYRPSDIVSHYLTGMRFGNVMLSTIQRGALSEAKQQIAEQQQLMRETTNMNASPEATAKAQEHYNKAVLEIMLHLHSKMPPVSE